MAFAFIDYKGLQVGNSTPAQAGGAAIDGNMRELADRVGPVASIVGTPGLTDDSANTSGNGTFQQWSKWRNLSTDDIYVCVDATPTAAVWVLVTAGGGGVGGADTQVQFNNGGAFAGSSNFIFNTASEVGIGGVPNPDSRLHVQGTGSAGVVTAQTDTIITLENNSNAYLTILAPDANQKGVFFGEPNNSLAGSILYNRAGTLDGIQFGTNGVLGRVVIDSNGRFGVGTLAPLTPLHIEIGSAGSVTPPAGTVATFESSGDTFIQLFAPDAFSSGLLFGNPSNNDGGAIHFNDGSPADGLEFHTGGSIVRMTIQGDGLVDIVGDAHVGGNLIVDGTTTTVNSETVNVADNHLYLNSGYTPAVAQTGGLVVNYLPTATVDSVSNGSFLAGVPASSNPIVTTVGAATFSTGDIVQISDTNLGENDGIFEVLSHISVVLTIRGIGLTATVEDFTDNQFITNASDNATITKVNVSLMRANTNGDWETAKGSATGLTFAAVASPGGLNGEVQFNNGGALQGIGGVTSSGGELKFADDVSLIIGDGNDLVIFHNGIDTRLTNNTGNFEITNGTGGNLLLRSTGATNQVVLKVGSDTTATRVDVRNSSDATLFAVLGDGAAILGGSGPVASALLQLDSTTRGFLPPRMTEVQRDAISSPATGLLIDNIDNDRLERFNGVDWGQPAPAEPLAAVLAIGNTSGGNDLIMSLGDSIGIGIPTPDSILHTHRGTAGVVAAIAFTTVTVEADGNNYISFLNPKANRSGLNFGNPTDGNLEASIIHNDTGLGGIDFRTGGNAVRLSIGDNGDVEFTNGQITTPSGGNGTDLNVNPGNGSTGPGGSYVVNAGNSGGAFAGGSITYQGGQGGLTGIGGPIDIMAGAGGSTSGAGGAVTITSGSGGPSSVGGLLTLQGGTAGSSALGGAILIQSGGSGTNGFPTGTVTIRSVNAGGGFNTSGVVNINTGNATGSSVAGAINIKPGIGGNTGTGGSVNITGGNGGTIVGNGGQVFVQGGESFTAGVGGILNLRGGNGLLSTGGIVRIDGGGGSAASANVLIQSLNGGSVGIGAAPHTSALLALTSTTQGLLPPPMTEVQRDAITAPATGLEITNTTSGFPEWFDSTKWQAGAPATFQRFHVRDKADLPAPVSGNIPIPAGSTLFVEGIIDLGTDNLEPAGDLYIFGDGFANSKITSSSANGTIDLGVIAGFVQANNVVLENTNATPDVFKMNNANSSFVVELVQLFGNVVVGDHTFVSYTRVFSFGQLHYTADAPQGSTTIDLSRFIQSSPITSVLIDDGVQTLTFAIRESSQFILDAAGTGIELEDPDSVNTGILDAVEFIGGGTPLRCNAINESTFSTPGLDPAGIAINGTGDLLIIDPVTNLIYQMNGITSSLNSSIATPAADGNGITWAKGNLISCDPVTDTIYVHAGFTTAITTSFAAPALNIRSLAFDGQNLISTDTVTGLVYIHDGISATILTSFSSASVTTLGGVAFDGVNVLVTDQIDGTTHVLEDFTGVTKYTFGPPSAAININDITISPGGFVSVDTTGADIYKYDTPVTFDHSSRTWQIGATGGVLVESSDRGGSNFETSNPLSGEDVTVVQNVWTDIAATNIAYGSLRGMEKCRLEDELNGAVLWTGTRHRGRQVIGQASFSRTGASADTAYELAIVINGIVQRDSVVRTVLATTGEFSTVQTLPITRILTDTNVVKNQIRNLTNTFLPEFVSAKMSIN